METKKRKPGAAGKPGVHVNPAALGRAIWRATVLEDKKPMDQAQHQALWQADRERYLELGRKVVKEIRAMRRERQAAGEAKQ
jgi:hypothetical protein